MEDETQNKDYKDYNFNKIEFNSITLIDNEDISIDLLNLQFDEKELLKVYDISGEWNKFFTEKEYQSLFEDNLEIKRANNNEVYSNPLYFIKKIIYFNYKEIYIKPFLFILKSPKKRKKINLIFIRNQIHFRKPSKAKIKKHS